MELYKSEYQIIEFFEEENVLKKQWFPKTEDMEPLKFKEEVLKIAEYIEKVKPLRILDITLDFKFPIVPELQTWVDEDVFPRFLAAGLKRYALLMSSEIVAQFSIEQTMEEGKGNEFQTKYFDDEEKALAWLNR